MGNKVTVYDHGPFKIEGDVELVDMDGKPIDTGGRPAIVLCRCGLSEVAPFCDGAHKRGGFQSCVRQRATE